jgi:serine/threonine-protein phosphatase 2A regulatory subunit B
MAQHRLYWGLHHVFHNKADGVVAEEGFVNTISSVEFSQTGEFLATGDVSGRVSVYKAANAGPTTGARNGAKARAGTAEARSVAKSGTPIYRKYTHFQSHEPEFDYLLSLSIDERINKIKWVTPSCGDNFCLTTNDKCIKLWKFGEQRMKKVTSLNFPPGRSVGTPAANFSSRHPAMQNHTSATLRLPLVQPCETVVAAKSRRSYANGHTYHINSLSLNSDGQTFLSADELRVNIWDLNRSDTTLNAIDLKPPEADGYVELITCAEFHPISCNIMIHSNSSGHIKMNDLRQAALADDSTREFFEQRKSPSSQMFAEVLPPSAVSDVKFSNCGRYILSRDFLTLKVWDVNMESKPLKTIQVHGRLRTRLRHLYEDDCLDFEKFECAFSHDASHIVTGSYSNMFQIYDRLGRTETCLEASLAAPKTGPGSFGRGGSAAGAKKGVGDAGGVTTIDFSKKVLHCAWHPQKSLVAIAAGDHLFLYDCI